MIFNSSFCDFSDYRSYQKIGKIDICVYLYRIIQYQKQMGPWINYHHLYYFKIIAEEGTVSAAAKKLRVGQPTLSAQLKQFEETLGVLLFERKHKKLILTEQGRVALNYSKNIFKMGSEMYEVLHDRLKPLKPTLHIGALDSIPKQMTLQIVKQAFKISPCQITLSEGHPDELFRELLAHRMDLVLSNFCPAGIDGKGLVHRSIIRKNVAFYGAPKFAKLRKGFPKSLSGEPMILPTYDGKTRQDLDHWAKLNGIELNVIAETQDIAVKKLMAISEMGLIPAASHTVKRQLESGELVELGLCQGITEELFLISAQRKIENSIAAKLMQTFKI